MEQANKINHDLKAKLFWGIFAGVAFVVGIPLIVFGAIKGIIFMLVLGILGVAFGFYGSPFLWISYGECRSLKRVVDAVMEEHITSVSEIARHLELKDARAKQSITKAINKKYITGYIFNGETLTPNEKQAPKRKAPTQRKCANCGGSLSKTETGWRCDYCASVFENE